jgi:dCMP deaminase
MHTKIFLCGFFASLHFQSRVGLSLRARNGEPSKIAVGGRSIAIATVCRGRVREVELYSPAMESERVSWERYFMNLAVQAATRSTCPRKHVGAIIVRDKTVLSTGYNGSIRGGSHCTEVGCLMDNSHCIRTVHAEANALVQAARHGTRLEGAQIFVTASPCFNCFKLIVNSGIASIYFGEFYRDEKVLQFADELGIEMVHLGLDDE